MNPGEIGEAGAQMKLFYDGSSELLDSKLFNRIVLSSHELCAE